MSAVAARLSNSRYPALRQLSCEVNGDTLILHGRVSTFHEKQQAQETARHGWRASGRQQSHR